ncbi:MAG: 3-hydroxyacyl-[acyl-carrier-protein] dehydratase FabZ [Deltaproteobacteria bacterium]|jgi:3-hydroxyacyl-[acyl-carrier-protein] dehydratase|nr:3-hydroxyacyl-[acyl-carrier-protein] dehydratase FabZ [Deltaproteobacteria bacterium]
MRYLLIDRIVKWAPGSQAEALKNVSLSEDFFDDHFPLKPIMPGTLIIEGMAQLAGLLLEETMAAEGLKIKALMSMVEKAKFRRPVYPGSQLIYRCSISQYNRQGGRASVEAFVKEAQAADCQLLFSFHQIDNPLLETIRKSILSTWLEDAQIL